MTVANIEAADGGAVILKGNQKVLSARLSATRSSSGRMTCGLRSAGMGEWVEGLKRRHLPQQARVAGRPDGADRGPGARDCADGRG